MLKTIAIEMFEDKIKTSQDKSWWIGYLWGLKCGRIITDRQRQILLQLLDSIEIWQEEKFI